MAASKRPPTSTTSTCTPATECGEHVFKIDGYSLCKGIAVGKFISSATFAVGGYAWRLRYYPNGDMDSSKDFVSVHVELLSADVGVSALYHLTLVEHSVRKSTWPKPTEPVEFRFSSLDGTTSYRGSARFVKRIHLENLFVRDDVLLIRCELTVIQMMKVSQPKMPKTFMDFRIQMPPSDLLDNLRNLLETGEGSDVSFKVKDEVFTAHKIVLAMRSPVFKAELYGPMREQQSITIEDMEPAVFGALLHFIYTDDLDDEDGDKEEETVKHLLVAADRYGIERMKLICERKLCEFLEAKTVASTLALADQHHCSKLKDACIEFINTLDRLDDVISSEGYGHLKRACPSVIIDIWEKAAKTRRM
ncbi:unnamed protein product [Alopecurus aequalis]